MEWICKGVLTAAVVAAVLFAARGWGRGAAGWLAGLPVTTVPMLAWLRLDHGVVFAADAAVASVAACGLLAVVALGVAFVLAGRHRAAVSASVAAAAFGLLLPWLAMHGSLAAATLVAVFGCALALRHWPDAVARPRRSTGSWRSASFTALVAAVVSVVASAAGPSFGMATAGWLASLPVVSASVAVSEGTAGGPAAVMSFLRGYVLGLIGRIAFGAVFVIGLDHTSFAMSLAGACAAAVACHVVVVAAGLARTRALCKLARCRICPPLRGPLRPR